MRLLTRALALLPAGTMPIAAGLAVLGVGSYAHLAIAGHSLSPAGFSSMSELWAVVFWLGLGLFFPVEQELIRLVAARKASGEGITPVVRRACALAGVILGISVAALAAAARLLADHLFDGDMAMVVVLATAFLALAVISVSRGVLAGMGRFPAYGTQLGIDGGLRIVLSGALGILGVHSAVAFGLILTAAPILSAIATIGPLLRDLHPGPPVTWVQMCQHLGLLIGTMTLAQLVVNVAVIDLKLLAPHQDDLVGALLAALVLARVPLFVFTSLQASLLPGLARAIALGDQALFRRLLIRGCETVIILGIVVGVPAVLLGPWLIQVLFNAQPVLGYADFAWLAAGTLFYMLAMVLGQGAMALSKHRAQLFAWIAGTVVLILVTVLPGDVTLRVEAAYALSSLTVALVLALVLLRAKVRADRSAAAALEVPAATYTGQGL